MRFVTLVAVGDYGFVTPPHLVTPVDYVFFTILLLHCVYVCGPRLPVLLIPVGHFAVYVVRVDILRVC